jgi:hypothetical protein
MSDNAAVEYINANFEASMAVPQTAQGQASPVVAIRAIRAGSHHHFVTASAGIWIPFIA